MAETCPQALPPATAPAFLDEARRMALSLGQLSPEEWTDQLHVNPQIAARTSLRFKSFSDEFLYGLLRPCDRIRPYRLEGHVRLPEGHGGTTLFAHWRPLLTEAFIARIREQGGTLANLASAEMTKLFDWKAVEQSVRVVTPDFYTLKGGRLKPVTVYAKMCRGEMTRFILKNRIGQPDDLKAFEWEGFAYDEAASRDGRMVFVNHG